MGDGLHGSETGECRPADDFSIDETAKWLGIGRNKVYELVDQGWLVRYTIGERTVRITRKSLCQYMHEMCPSQYPGWPED
jgi:excisionase family DNA binding protein